MHNASPDKCGCIPRTPVATAATAAVVITFESDMFKLSCEMVAK